MRNKLEVIKADWPGSKNVHAYSTTRISGVSQGVYSGLNLAMHVEDEASHVAENRQLLARQLELPEEPVWLNQVHGNQLLNIDEAGKINAQPVPPQADASYSLQAGKVCVVMTADCLPVLICNRKGDKVAAAHAGWRGLAAGIIEASVAALNEPVEDILVWLGPAIGAQAFEVGEDVREAFTSVLPQADVAFKAHRPGHYFADIYQLARLKLNDIGVQAIYGGEHCTFNDADHFYSYRRDGKTGRQASLIWFS